MASQKRQVIQAAIGLLVGGFLLWWLFGSVSWAEFRDSLRNMRTGWLLLALVPMGASFVLRVQRWKYVVRVVVPRASFRQMFSATQIGFLANFTLPARVGELVRALVLARLTRASFSKCLALAALDRVNDLIGLMPVLLIAVLAFRPDQSIEIPRELFRSEAPILVPANMYHAGAWFAVALLVGVVVTLVLLYANKALALRLSDRIAGMISRRLAQWAHRMLEQFAEGLHVFRSASDMAKSVGVGLATWAMFLLFMVSMLNAFGIERPWYTPFVMQAALAVCISIPGTPGFIGQFQVPLVASLKMVLPDISFADALALAVVAHLINVVFVALLGAACLYAEGFSLMQLTRESAETQEALEEHPSEEGAGIE